jgi:hypothetical protein
LLPQDAIVAVYEGVDGAEEAVRQLQRSGFDTKELSIVVHDYRSEEHVGYYNTGNRMEYWASGGTF